MPDSGTVGNVIKGAGELLFTGASNLADGNIKTGFGHTLAGVLGGALLGPLGIILVKANSFSTSVSGKAVYTHVGELFSRRSSNDSAAS